MERKYAFGLGIFPRGGGDDWKQPEVIFEAAADAGYTGVDFDVEPDRIESDYFYRVADLAKSHGLAIPSLIGAWGIWHAGEERDLASSDPEIRGHAVRYAQLSIDLAAGIDVPPLFDFAAVTSDPTYPVTKVAPEILRQNFVAATREIAAYAADKGVRVAVEPINRFEGYAGFLNSLPQALSIVQEIDDPNLGVVADLFHMNIEETSIPEALRLAGGQLSTVHLTESNRQILGTGHIDYAQVVRALDAIGYDGWMEVKASPPLPDWKTVAVESLEYMRRIERTAVLETRLTQAATYSPDGPG